jgi:hydroxyethylthiazole kinase
MDVGAKEERDQAWWGQRAWSLLSAVRARAPLVQCITNLVSMDIAANVLLASGASPAMVHSLREVPDFTPRCAAVYINVGTLSEDWLPSMRAAACAGRPWVLDPVAAAASGFRMEACLELLSLCPAVVRGNASEILALASRSAAASSSNFKVLYPLPGVLLFFSNSDSIKDKRKTNEIIWIYCGSHCLGEL